MSATGLAFDGTYLWLSDARQGQLLQLDPEDMTVLKSFRSAGWIPLGLAWNGSSLFAVDGESNNIFEIDTSGNVLEVRSTPLVDPFGITFDGEDFWVLDDRTKRIYQLAVPEPSSFTVLALAAIVCVLFQCRGGKRSVR